MPKTNLGNEISAHKTRYAKLQRKARAERATGDQDVLAKPKKQWKTYETMMKEAREKQEKELEQRKQRLYDREGDKLKPEDVDDPDIQRLMRKEIKDKEEEVKKMRETNEKNVAKKLLRQQERLKRSYKPEEENAPEDPRFTLREIKKNFGIKKNRVRAQRSPRTKKRKKFEKKNLKHKCIVGTIREGADDG